MAASETTATFAVELRDGVSSGARSAGEALADLKGSLLGNQTELFALNKAISQMKAGGMKGSEAFKELQMRADALKKSIATDTAGFVKLGGDVKQLANLQKDAAEAQKKAAAEEAEAKKKLAADAAAAAAAQKKTVQDAATAQKAFTASLAAGALAAVAVFVALATAIARAAVALAQYGLAAANARRDELLHLEGLVSIRSWYTRAAGSATELQSAIDGVSASSAISRQRVAGYAEQLYRAGLRGQTLEDALRGVSTVAAVQGEAMADRFRGMAIGAARTGRSVRDLADGVERRLGGTARRMGLSWDRQMERLRESWAGLFSEIRLDGALESLDEVLSIFSATTVTGRALRTILTSLFQPLLDGVDGVGSPVREFFEGVILQTLRIGIAFLRVRNFLIRTFAPLGEAVGQLGGLVDMAVVGRLALVGVGVALAPLVVLLGLAGALVLSLGANLLALGLFVTGVARSVSRLGETIGEWRSLGRSLIDGLVGGLMGRAGEAWKAVTTIGTGMTDALRTALDIHSPSRVFAELGRQIPRGLALGVEAEASLSSSAIEGLAAVPQGGALPGSGGGPGASVYITMENHFHGTPQEQQGQARETLRDLAAEVFEGYLVEAGGANA